MGLTPVVDLFAGAGGLSVGAAMAGADVRLAVELDQLCCDTMQMNTDWHRGKVLQSDVRELSGDSLRKLAGLSKKDQLIVIGGPPCQPFSKAAYWTDPGDEAAYRRARARGDAKDRPQAPPPVRPDKRRTLVEEFMRVVIEANADAFVFENVASIKHPRNKPVFDWILNEAKKHNFAVTVIDGNAIRYGVPQKRRRIFVIGTRSSPAKEPEPTHAEQPGESLFLREPVTAGDALEKYRGDEFFEPEEIISGKWAKHLEEVPPGMNYKAHTAWAGHPNPTFETETRFWNFLLKLHPDLPSWTIAAQPGPWTGPFHWDTRRLRTPELAALQTFPAGYKFAGGRRDRVRQIGNAVPPKMASRMIEQAIKAITSN